MRATGIIRRVDDLGRIVIPKEIRRTLRIHEGDPFEIFLDHGEITFKKYSFLGSLETYAKDFVQVMSQIFLMNAAICDMDTIIAYMGDSRYRCQEQRISEEVNRAIIERKTIIQSASQGHVIPLIEKACWTPKSLLLVPITNLGETLGAINRPGDYMGSGYDFLDSFNRIFDNFVETADDEFYTAICGAAEKEIFERKQKMDGKKEE